jgi:transposase
VAKKIELQPHQTSDQLRALYRSSSGRVERARLQALWMLAEGHPRQEVARSMGYGAEWVRRVAARYNASGLASVNDGRHKNPGHPPLLDAAQRAELEQALEGSFVDGTPWSGPKVAQWMSEKLGRAVPPQRGWDYLRRTEHTLQTPRPRHQGGDAEAQACFPAGAAESL